MQALIRNNGYSLFLRVSEVSGLEKNSSLQTKLYDETSGRIDTGKLLHLGLGGNRKGIDASLKEENKDVYVRVTKLGKRKLLSGEAVISRYSLGTINLQVE